MLAVACAPPQSATAYVFRGPTMGTSYAVKVVAEESIPTAEQEEIQRLITAELERINGRMSTYLADSEISRFNQHLSLEPFAVSAETGQVIAVALEIGRASGGAFDITVGPLVDAWGFGPQIDVPPRLPQERIDELLTQVGGDKLILDATSVRKLHPELVVDLSAIAKGYAVDRVVESLAERGWSDLLVDIGGEVRALGRNPDGEVWRLGIERPRFDLEGPVERGAVQIIVPLDDLAMATSGDYRNYREVDGERLSHILDPRDGLPVRHRLSSVSVVHRQCMNADAWATALLVLGPDEGLRLAREQGLAAFFLVREPDGSFSSRATAEFDALRAPAAARRDDDPAG